MDFLDCQLGDNNIESVPHVVLFELGPDSDIDILFRVSNADLDGIPLLLDSTAVFESEEDAPLFEASEPDKVSKLVILRVSVLLRVLGITKPTPEREDREWDIDGRIWDSRIESNIRS